MLNGKFYTGLPEKMMNRKKVLPDRQESHFFWPDDSNRKTERPSKYVNRQTDNVTQINGHDDRTPPKELARQQLSSKIEFDDNGATPKMRRRKPYGSSTADGIKTMYGVITDNVPTAKDKRKEHFVSNIEFYDFKEDEKLKTAQPTPNKVTVNTNKKGILKNNETKKQSSREQTPERKSIEVKKNPLPRLSMSKSVDNMAKISNTDLKTILKPEQKPQPEIKVSKDPIQSFKSGKGKEITHRIRQEEGNYERRGGIRNYDREGSEESRYHNKDYNNRRYNDNDYDDYYDKYSSQRPVNRNRSDFYGHPEHFRQSRPYMDSDDKEFDDRFKDMSLHREPNKFNNTKPLYNQRKIPSNYDDEPYYERYNGNYVRKHRDPMEYEEVRDQRSPPKRIESEVEKPHRSVTINEDRTKTHYINQSNNKPKKPETERRDVPNEARARAHTHLQSNITFTDNNYMDPRKPLSIRQAAVTRVTAGLPDI